MYPRIASMIRRTWWFMPVSAQSMVDTVIPDFAVISLFGDIVRIIEVDVGRVDVEQQMKYRRVAPTTTIVVVASSP